MVRATTPKKVVSVEEPVTVEKSPEELAVINTTFKLEIAGEIYTIKKPVGPLGGQHISLMVKALPKSRDERGNLIPSPKDQINFDEAFAQWCQKILPHCIVDGPYKYEEMPGEDQYAIFNAMFMVMNLQGDLFRFVQ